MLPFSSQDEIFMRSALEQAQKALDCGEVPVGCVITKDELIVSVGHNQTNMTKNGTRHAEMIAIDALLRSHNGSVETCDFASCNLYVTCEPCIMCAGALSLLKFKRVIFGCANDKFGGNGSILSIHKELCGNCGDSEGSRCGGAEYSSVGGLFKEEAIKLLQDFYISGNPKAPKPHRPVINSGLRASGPLSLAEFKHIC